MSNHIIVLRSVQLASMGYRYRLQYGWPIRANFDGKKNLAKWREHSCQSVSKNLTIKMKPWNHTLTVSKSGDLRKAASFHSNVKIPANRALKSLPVLQIKNSYSVVSILDWMTPPLCKSWTRYMYILVVTKCGSSSSQHLPCVVFRGELWQVVPWLF